MKASIVGIVSRFLFINKKNNGDADSRKSGGKLKKSIFMNRELKNSVAVANFSGAMEAETIQKNAVIPKNLRSRNEMKEYLVLTTTIFIIFFQSTALNAQMSAISASIGYSGKRGMNMNGYGDLKSNNTICADIGFGHYWGQNVCGFGLSGGIGIKSFELSNLSDLTQGSLRKANWELSIGPALYIGAPPIIEESLRRKQLRRFGNIDDEDFRNGSIVGLVLSAQPSYNFAKLLSAENSVVVGSWGVKLAADIRIWYFTLGVCYNPFNVKLYKNNTNTNYFGSYNGKIINVRPALEFRIGALIGMIFE